MKGKLVLLLAAVCFCFGGLRAQEADGGVKFVEGKTFNEALALAKESGKMLFVDCYTSWCGPCRMMATKVFPQKLMGDYFNEKFVSVKIDMEKGEGPELHKRFNVRAYPTFLFLDADGKELNRIVGGDADAAKFLAKVKEGLGEKGLAAMTARYEGGERDTTFLMDYLEIGTLEMAAAQSTPYRKLLAYDSAAQGALYAQVLYPSRRSPLKRLKVHDASVVHARALPDYSGELRLGIAFSPVMEVGGPEVIVVEHGGEHL